MLNSAKISTEWEDGKYVVNTSKVETAWLHWPGITINRASMYIVPMKQNIMVHMRNWTVVNNPTEANLQEKSHIKIKKFHMHEVVPQTSANRIQENFQNFVKDKKEFQALPNQTHYLPLIEQSEESIARIAGS
uniref:Glycosyltransferase family 92 protein n=1 Tax=Acrobeloides nanus TaxID=290746 RepID=A0A914E6S9_9BILA